MATAGSSYCLKVIFTWMEGKLGTNGLGGCVDGPKTWHHSGSIVEGLIPPYANVKCVCNLSKIGKRKHVEPCDDDSVKDQQHPMNEMLLWHNAIKGELNEIAQAAKRIQISGDCRDLLAFNERLQFIAEVCIFHRSLFSHLTEILNFF